MLTGPVPVTEKILKDSGMSISDIDLFEVNEAFASVVLRFMQAFQVDPAQGERQRRLDRAWPPAGGHRRHHHRHPAG
jgi:acetyl-CoA acetyltransferase